MLFVQSFKTGIKNHTGITVVCSLPEKLRGKEMEERKQTQVPT